MKYEKTESTVMPSPFRIGYKIGNQIQLAFPDEIEKITRKDENGEDITMYSYYEYIIKVFNREQEELIENVNLNLEEWKQFAKDEFIKAKSAEIREIRDKLLAETDQYFLLDRIGLSGEVTIDTLLNFVNNSINSDIAEYRQALRDITEQEGFPYEVIFPKNPNDKESEG